MYNVEFIAIGNQYKDSIEDNKYNTFSRITRSFVELEMIQQMLAFIGVSLWTSDVQQSFQFRPPR